MATANNTLRSPSRPVRRSRWLRRLVLVAIAAGGVALALYWRPLHAKAQTGVSYGARVACSCRFVAGRRLGDCRDDFEPGMWPIMLSEDAEAKSVTARFPLFASQTATFHEGAGCVLEPWAN